MGNVRKYDPVPPPSESLNTSEFPLKLAKLTVNPALKGVKKYRIELANEVRARYLDHPVYGGDWRSLILDFDRKCLGLTKTIEPRSFNITRKILEALSSPRCLYS